MRSCLLVSVALVWFGAGGLSGYDVAATKGPSDPTEPSLVATEPTEAPRRASRFTVDLPARIQGGAPVDDVIAAAWDVTGPSDDPVGQLNRFVPVVGGLPAPDGASVVAFRVQLFESPSFEPGEPPSTIASSSVTYEVPGSFDDVVVFFRTTMLRDGYVFTGDRSTDADGSRSITLEYEDRAGADPHSSWVVPDLEVTVSESPDRPVRVEVEQVASEGARVDLTRYGGMLRDAPLLDESRLVGATVSVDTNAAMMQLGVSYLVAGTEADVVAHVTDALPTAAFTLVTPWDGYDIELGNPMFDTVRLRASAKPVTEGGEPAVEVTVSGLLSM